MTRKDHPSWLAEHRRAAGRCRAALWRREALWSWGRLVTFGAAVLASAGGQAMPIVAATACGVALVLFGVAVRVHPCTRAKESKLSLPQEPDRLRTPPAAETHTGLV